MKASARWSAVEGLDVSAMLVPGPMRQILNRGAVFGCALALLACATAWLAPAAFASDSIYWSSYTNAGAVRVGDLGGSAAMDLFGGETNPQGVAIDPAAGKIYWADLGGTIRVANLDGTGARDLYTGESKPSGVAIDPAAGLIYWADAVSRTGAIRVGSLDGSTPARTLFANESYPVGLVIDPAAGTIYWGSYDTFKIRVGNLNGTGARDLFTTVEYYPTGLVIDTTAGKLYWTNEFAGNVRVGNLDGTGATSLYAGQGQIGGLALDPAAGKIYWGDWANGTVRVGSVTGAPPQNIYTGETSPWNVALLRAPLGTSVPQVSGAGVIGQTLSCTPGNWAADYLSGFLYRAPQSFSYQWTVGGVPIAGATSNSVLVRSPGEYRCDVTATNAAGSTTQTSAPTNVPVPPPLLGRLVNAAPVSGKVFVLVNGRLVPLTAATQIQSGAVVDALHGTVSLTSATGKGKKTQTGRFGGAVFKVTQAKSGKSKGLTTLALVEGAKFKGAPAYATCKAHKATDATIASSKTLQLLKASAHGKFRTNGRYSAATVRGTKWTVADRCDGTRTHVITDSVAVTDFVRHKTIVLHAGQSYLAKKPK